MSARIPELASDAQISGLWRLLEHRDERDELADDIARERAALERDREQAELSPRPRVSR